MQATSIGSVDLEAAACSAPAAATASALSEVESAAAVALLAGAENDTEREIARMYLSPVFKVRSDSCSFISRLNFCARGCAFGGGVGAGRDSFNATSDRARHTAGSCVPLSMLRATSNFSSG